MTILSSHTVHTRHAPEEVFTMWADPGSWPTWDSEVREVSCDGRAVRGARGRMRPASGPATAFVITDVQADRVFTNASSMPGATLTFEHRVEPTPEGSMIEVTVSIDGFLAPLWRRVMGRGMAGAARSSVEGLVAHLDAVAVEG